MTTNAPMGWMERKLGILIAGTVIHGHNLKCLLILRKHWQLPITGSMKEVQRTVQVLDPRTLVNGTTIWAGRLITQYPQQAISQTLLWGWQAHLEHSDYWYCICWLCGYWERGKFYDDKQTILRKRFNAAWSTLFRHWLYWSSTKGSGYCLSRYKLALEKL